jgi:hypothetical protein
MISRKIRRVRAVWKVWSLPGHFRALLMYLGVFRDAFSSPDVDIDDVNEFRPRASTKAFDSVGLFDQLT